MARRKSSRGRVFYYPSSLPKMQDGDRIINEDTEKVRIRVDVANDNTSWSEKLRDAITNPHNYSQAEVIHAITTLAGYYPDSDVIYIDDKISPSETGTRYVEKDPATGLPKLKKGGNIQKQGYKDNSPYRNRPYIDIYSNNITMDGVSQPLRVKTDRGEERILEPNSGEYYFPGANVVREMPLRDTPLYFSPSSRGLAKYQTGGFLPMYEEGGDVSEENVTEENVSDATIDEYIETLMQQENAAMKGYDAEKGLWFPHDAPEEGGGKDIGYGHKIKSDEDFSEGLTDAQVRSLLASDLTEKMDSAARKFNNKSYDRTWDDLSTEEQILLTDYEYNVGLTKFPKLMKAVAEQDVETMLSQYKRYSDGKPLTSRNNWTKGFIEDKIKRVPATLEEETIETLKTTPIDNKVAPNVILNTFPQGQTQNLETKSSEAIPNPVQSTYSLEKVTQAPYPIREEQLGTLDERQYTLDNIVSPVVGNPYKGKDNYSRTRGPGEKGSGLYDTEGKKYSLVDYYDKKTGEKVGTYNPMTNQVIDEYQKGGKFPDYYQYGYFDLQNFSKPLIKVTDPNDPRLLNFNDSLYLANKSNSLDYLENHKDEIIPWEKASRLPRDRDFEEYMDPSGKITPIGAIVERSGNGKKTARIPVYKYPTQPYLLVDDLVKINPENVKRKEYVTLQNNPNIEKVPEEKVPYKKEPAWYQNTGFNNQPVRIQPSNYDPDATYWRGEPYQKEYKDGGQLPRAQEGKGNITYLPDRGGYQVPVDLETGNIKGGILDEVIVSGKATPLVRHKRAYETNNPFDAQQYATDLFNNPKSREEYIDRINKDRFFQKYGQRGYNEFQDNAWKYAAEQRMSQLPQGNRSRIEYLNDLTAKEEELFKKYNSALQTTYSADFVRAVNAKDRESYDQLKDKLYNGPEKDLYTEREKQNMLQNYKYIGGVHEGDALAPLTWMSKPIQSIYRDDYSGYDALVGRKNDATFKEDLITDPTLIYGLTKTGLKLGAQGLKQIGKYATKSFIPNLDDVGAQAFKPVLNTKQLSGSTKASSIDNVGKVKQSLKTARPSIIPFDESDVIYRGELDNIDLKTFFQNQVEPNIEKMIDLKIKRSKDPRGFKLLVDQEKEYLKKIGVKEDMLDKLAKDAANSRIKELEQIKNQKLWGPTAKDNAYHIRSSNPINEINDDFLQTYTNTPPPSIKKLLNADTPIDQITPKMSETLDLRKNTFKEHGIYPNVYDNKALVFGKYHSNPRTIAHEMGHISQGNRILPIEERLRKAANPTSLDGTETLQLNDDLQASYNYFTKNWPTSKRKTIEPLPFAHETKQLLLDRGIIKDWFDEITEETLKKAKKSFDKAPVGVYDPITNTFKSETRVLDFTHPSRYKMLAKELNKIAPVAIPATISTGVVGSQYFSNPQEQVEYRNGGQLPKAEVMIDPATGLPKLKKGGKAWIQRTIKKRKKIK